MNFERSGFIEEVLQNAGICRQNVLSPVSLNTPISKDKSIKTHFKVYEVLRQNKNFLQQITVNLPF